MIAPEELADFVERWYGRLPRREEIPVWILAARGIAEAIMNRKNHINVRITEDEGIVGYWEPHPSSTIVIGELPFRQDLLMRYCKSTKFIVPTLVALLNGIICHESGHAAWSLPKISDALDLSPFLKNDALSGAILNIVEDMWLEDRIKREFTAVKTYIEAANQIIFDDESITMRCEAWAIRHDAAAAMDLIIACKRSFLPIEGDDVLQDIAEPLITMLEADDEHLFNMTHRDRVFVAEEVRRRFDKYFEGSYNSSEFNEMAPKNGRFTESDKQMTSPGSETSDRNKEETHSKGVVNVKAVEGMVKELSEQDTVDFAAAGSRNIFMKKLTPGTRDVRPDETYDHLGVMLREIRTVATTYGTPKERGRPISTRLSRIAIDGKVSGDEVHISKGTKKYRFVILVDCSGSMREEIRLADPKNPRSWTSTTRLQAAIRASLGCKKALQVAGLPAAVYGHTADDPMDRSVQIYEFSGFNESWEQMIARCSSPDIHPTDNADGYAIEWIGKNVLQPDPRSIQILIVISDGQPSATEYSGSEAERHTRTAVETIRKTGTRVYSISISSTAKYANDRIYGPGNNFLNDDPNVVEQIVERIIRGDK